MGVEKRNQIPIQRVFLLLAWLRLRLGPFFPLDPLFGLGLLLFFRFFFCGVPFGFASAASPPLSLSTL